jgi:hypothetical protein
MIYKISHRKLKIEQHEPTKNRGWHWNISVGWIKVLKMPKGVIRNRKSKRAKRKRTILRYKQ